MDVEAQLRRVGAERYHHQHPFHLMMHEGKLSRGQMQAWALNRYYYQSRIPIKDAIILSRSDDLTFAGLGASALWITTAILRRKAVSSAGSGWRRQPALTVSA